VPVLLIVMHESGTWRIRPGQILTFGRSAECTITLPADRGVSRSAGSLVFEQGTWWLRNDSSSSVLYVSGDRGFRVDLPPGMRAPVQQWHAKIRLQGVLGSYMLRLRLPGLDDMPEQDPEAGQGERIAASPTGEHLVTSTRRRPPLSGSDRLILAARFEDYLNWRHTGPATPRSAKETAERIGWQAHAVAKRCENIRDRYSRLGVPGLRGPRALEELAMLLISTGELAANDLRRLPSRATAGQDPG
jgi:predicted component of type VI protein secretion system